MKKKLTIIYIFLAIGCLSINIFAQKISPARSPEQAALFQQLIARAQSRNGTVKVLVLATNSSSQEQLIQQLAQFQVQITTRYQFIPALALRANAEALIYMRDSPLVAGIEDNEILLSPTTPSRSPEQEALFQRLIQQAAAEGPLRVIVELNINFTPEGYLTPEQRIAQRNAIALAQENLLNRLVQFQARLTTRYQFIPHMTLEVNAAALEFLRASPLVKTIEENRLLKPSLEESVPLIGAPDAWNRGFSGAGQTIAVLDTGVDKNHIFLRNKVVSEACYSTNGSGASSLCPGGVAESTAPNSGLPCDASILNCRHGTHVAGIAAGNYPEINLYGVARDAQLISIQIFSNFSGSLYSTTEDMNKGLQRVQVLSGTYNIAAINLSLGGGENTSYCDESSPVTRDAINTLRSYGIATVIASGNDAFTNAINFPACISAAVSVASTQDSGVAVDTVSTFSNSASFLSLLAPGSIIHSSVPGGGFAYMNGTSMAAPHVAGAWAILKQRVPFASVDRTLRILQATGKPIQNQRNGITKPLIQVDTALLRLVSPIFDYDNDDKSDISVFRPSNGTWYLQRSQDGFTGVQFGASDDRIAPADYDGDGKTDIAVFRPSNGVWYVLRSSDGGITGVQWGFGTDIVAPADYDGDGRTDFAIFRPDNGIWYILQSSDGNPRYVQFGQNGDIPVPGDYDGDERADAAVFRPSNGTWYILQSRSNTTTTTQLGALGDKPVQSDYDADGKTDVAVFRPQNGTWYLLRSQDGYTVVPFGSPTDLPVPADYDGDRRVDIAVFRPSDGNWFLRRWAIAPNFDTVLFGQNGDKPTPNAYIP